MTDELPDDVEELDAEIERLRNKSETLESDLNEIQNVIQFNEKMLSEDSRSVVADLDEDAEALDDEYHYVTEI